MIQISDLMIRHYGVALASFKEKLAYRFDFFTSFISSLMVTFLLYYLWSAIYENASNIQISFQSMITYITLGQAFNFTRLGQRNTISQTSNQIYSGDIILDLIRPIDYQSRQLANLLGLFVLETLVVSIPIYVFAIFYFDIHTPVSLEATIGFLISLFGAFILSFTIDFFVSILAFWTYNKLGLIFAKKAILDIFAGTLIPISLFPDWLERIALLLPFQGIAYTPLSIYIGTISGAAIWRSLAIQVIWIIVMVVLTRLVWLRALKRVVIQGG